jgi:putative ABC transport system substrate-binding protein
MKRRDFISLIGGAATMWPFAARGQQPAMPVIGFLASGGTSGGTYPPLLAGLLQGLKEAGFVEGQNMIIASRYPEGGYQQLPSLASDLVSRRVTAIVAGGPPAAKAAKAATSTIPIIFTSGADPVEIGLVASLNRPGGNLTGVHIFVGGLEAKKFGLLRELVPHVSVIAILLNPNAPNVEAQSKDLQAAANVAGQQVQIFSASSENDIDIAYQRIAELRPTALVVGADPFLDTRRSQIVALSARYAIPTVYETRNFITIGGLMSYGTNFVDAYHQAGGYLARVLKGENPADLPVLQSTRFELVINLKTAKTLGLTIPSGVLAIADEVIE